MPFQDPEHYEVFGRYWKSIVSEEELVCGMTNTRSPGWARPRAIIVDVRKHRFSL